MTFFPFDPFSVETLHTRGTAVSWLMAMFWHSGTSQHRGECLTPTSGGRTKEHNFLKNGFVRNKSLLAQDLQSQNGESREPEKAC